MPVAARKRVQGQRLDTGSSLQEGEQKDNRLTLAPGFHDDAFPIIFSRIGTWSLGHLERTNDKICETVKSGVLSEIIYVKSGEFHD